MPVKVLSKEYMEKMLTLDNPNVSITRSELSRGMYNFVDHYNHVDEDRGYSTNFMVKYSEFLEVVVNPIIDPMHVNHVSDYSIHEDDLAFKFQHWFDNATKEWFLMLQCCELASSAAGNHGQIPSDKHYSITAKGYWYELKNGRVTKLSSMPNSATNPYFEKMRYLDNDTISSVNPTIHVNHLVFPWKNEIKQMYVDNINLSNNVYLVFAGFSSYQLIEPNWPHGLVVYLNDDGRERLTNNSTISVFSNKGADFATMCPPNANCPYYILPDELSRY